MKNHVIHILENIHVYYGHIGAIDIVLFRGAYVIKGMIDDDIVYKDVFRKAKVE
ncbi:hypothetical protein [Bizionia argentinensis]|uniref:hypothetical protein n=1 Tax=Bizionia argentinensis TaxID=456455 RepID=UPI0002230F5A|nr:hypothetical protein [Bizionia argentinensis]